MVKEADEQLFREDFCADCWGAKPSQGDPKTIGFWRTTVPAPREKKKLLVDDELLINFFQRLEDAAEPVQVNLRFVLALVLMRKKLLIYDRSDKGPDGSETWVMHLRGRQETCRVTNPHMDDDKVSEVSRQLGQVMEADL